MIEYVAGFDEDAFVWHPDRDKDKPIPVILSEATLESWRLTLGDTIYIHRVNRTTPWSHLVQVVGTYPTFWIMDIGDGVILPVSALETLQGRRTMYSIARFEIDPSMNSFRFDIKYNKKQ